MAYYIGVLSGTSMDGINAVLINIEQQHLSMLAHHEKAIPVALKTQLQHLAQAKAINVDVLGQADATLGTVLAQTVNELIAKTSVSAKRIEAIGSHGQTIRHRPLLKPAFSWQIGDPNLIAALTGMTTIADFRRMDMALGGQGAPLATAFHNWLFRKAQQNRCLVNIGGIANVSFLPGELKAQVLGFDTGPGNRLMDAWIEHKQHKSYDDQGAWAKTGKVIPALLHRFLQEPFFAMALPKSTGRELFNLNWLQAHIKAAQLEHAAPEDIQATLLALTAVSISQAIKPLMDSGEIYLCGGGAYNQALVECLTKQLAGFTVASSAALGLDPEWVEACTFAWLAKQRLDHQAGNLPSVTGAASLAVLGAIYAKPLMSVK